MAVSWDCDLGPFAAASSVVFGRLVPHRDSFAALAEHVNSHMWQVGHRPSGRVSGVWLPAGCRRDYLLVTGLKESAQRPRKGTCAGLSACASN